MASLGIGWHTPGWWVLCEPEPSTDLVGAGRLLLWPDRFMGLVVLLDYVDSSLYVPEGRPE